VSPEDWARQLELEKKLGPVFRPSFGLHPWWVISQSEAVIAAGLTALERALPQACALGELGLDYGDKHGGKSTAAKQEAAFAAQLRLARRVEKPLILHVVRAHGEALAALRREGPWPRGGLVHSFAGTPELAREYVDLGFLVSVGTAATREGSRHLQNALKWLPPESLVIETDAPDQLPSGAPGPLNEPANLIHIAEAVSRWRNEPAEEILRRSTRNIRRVLGE
jgi:TatD DNase family protein